MTINWDSVFDTIIAGKLADWDKELVAAAVTKAVEEWTLRLDKDVRIVSTETYSDDPFPYLIDVLQETAAGTFKIVDWKTKKTGKLDDRWVLKQSRSRQPRLYAAAVATKYGPDVFPVISEIRGVTLEEKPSTRTLQMEFGIEDARRAIYELRQIDAERRALLNMGHIPWIRDSKGCRLFGDWYKCEFEPYCWGEKGQLIQLPVGDITRAERPFSHSSAEEYLRCPERYRLLRVLEKQDDDEDVAQAGRVFHSAMEDIYRQIKAEQESKPLTK